MARPGAEELVKQPPAGPGTVPRSIDIGGRGVVKPAPRDGARGLAGRIYPNPSPPIPNPLNIRVHAELVRMRTQLELVALVLGLVPDPGVDHVGREDVATQQELVVLAERG